jgi:hypothetical protein
LLAVGGSSCGNKSGDDSRSKNEKREFGWKDNVSVSDIPDFPVKGLIKGKEVSFQYINFEKWRGSGDNVINFSVSKPGQNCGFVEDFEGFTLMNKGGEIKQGEWKKTGFNDDPSSYKALFKTGGASSSEPWNCALNIESISDKVVKGRVVIFFNDQSRSWLAGKFEAMICNN